MLARTTKAIRDACGAGVLYIDAAYAEDGLTVAVRDGYASVADLVTSNVVAGKEFEAHAHLLTAPPVVHVMGTRAEIDAVKADPFLVTLGSTYFVIPA